MLAFMSSDQQLSLARAAAIKWAFITAWLILSALTLFPTSSVHADVRISNMDNIGLGSWGGSGAVQSDDDVCIFNDGGPNYLVTASGSGGGGAFQLVSGGNNISYQMQFRGSSGGFTTLTANSSQGFSSANQVSDTCGGSTNATIRISVPESNLLAAAKGSYSGILSIQIDPN